jgi:hypothetical protein
MKWEMALLLAALVMVIRIQGHIEPAPPGEASATSLPISFQLLGKTRYDNNTTPIYPDELRACEGRTVTLSGFATPYDDPQHPTKMLLTQNGSGCFFCAPPDASGVVLVRCASNDVLVPWGAEAVTLEGTLRLARPDSADVEAKRFLFVIDGARVVRNHG